MIELRQYYIAALVAFLSLSGCVSVPKVSFETPVDTRSKKIFYQEKKTFSLSDIGVYLSNDFDGARLNRVQKVNDTLIDLYVYPENGPINNSAYYAFNVWSSIPKNIYFRFNYPEGYRHRYIPKVKINNNWKALDSSRILKNDDKATIKLELSNNPLIVAAQELQTSKDVNSWYSNLLEGKEEYAQIVEFGKSTLGKPLPVLSIGYGSPKSKDVIVLLTRQHPPEVTGFFAFKSFLSTILRETDLSRDFLKKYHIIAFPIMNPDGVDLGHWRHNANGVDTNRDWSVYNQKEIKHAVKYIQKHLKKHQANLILGLDFHSTYNDVFYTNEIRKSTTIPNFIESWFAALESNIPDYTVNEASSNSTKPVSKGWFLYGHDAVGITYEIGDKTPKNRIDVIGRTSATEMMKILLK